MPQSLYFSIIFQTNPTSLSIRVMKDMVTMITGRINKLEMEEETRKPAVKTGLVDQGD